ncbi:MAG: hypothetical protein AAF587_20400 [Bacteroidota bacterium]
MKISPRSPHASSSAEELSTLVARGQFHEEDLQTYFQDSQVRRVFIDHHCAKDIYRWAEQSLSEEVVPEVGGFLLGRFCEYAPHLYDITIEIFIQAREVDFSSPILLDFGSQVMLEMDQIKDTHPQLVNVGWFHTHPGHTPFLSEQDLSSHEGFFQKPFQVAIVLDSLTRNFDTGIFSRKSTGQVNNKEDRTTWISWKQLGKMA